MSSNYCAHALDGRDQILANVRRSSGPVHAERYREHFDELRNSVKFALPDGGRVLGMDGASLTKMLISTCRLPFPVVALEYTVTPETAERATEGQFVVRERILVCAETGDPTYPVKAQLWIQMDGQWFPWATGMVFGPNEAGSGLAYRGFANVPSEGREEVLAESVGNDYFDELGVIADFLAALSCRNVITVDGPAPSVALNKARQKRGKQPFFTYKVLTIEVPNDSVEGPPRGGTHASPRVHLRRGHIRHLPSGNVWVNAAVVGNKRLGMVSKDYRISGG